MSYPYDIHADFQSLPSFNLSYNRLVAGLLNGFMALERKRHRNTSSVTMKNISIARQDGSKLPLILMTPEESQGPLPCLIYYHGGAFALTYGSSHITLCQHYAETVGCSIVFADYRLMPAHPFPAGQDDCYTALEWVSKNAADINVDRNRIAVGGDSAGGALSASVCQMNLDRGTTSVCGQLLIYPVTDKDCKTRSATEFDKVPVFTATSNTRMWKAYLKNCAADAIPPYASPIHRDNFEGLPPAYVETAEFDPLHDEGINYAKKLIEAGVDVVLNETKGTVHGFDAMGETDSGTAALAQRCNYLRTIFKQEQPTQN